MPDTPPPPSGIDKKIADAVANEDYELAAKLKKVKTQPPPPPPKPIYLLLLYWLGDGTAAVITCCSILLLHLLF